MKMLFKNMIAQLGRVVCNCSPLPLVGDIIVEWISNAIESAVVGTMIQDSLQFLNCLWVNQGTTIELTLSKNSVHSQILCRTIIYFFQADEMDGNIVNCFLLDYFILSRRGFRNVRSPMASLSFDNFNVRLLNAQFIYTRKHAYIPNQRDELYLMVSFNL